MFNKISRQKIILSQCRLYCLDCEVRCEASSTHSSHNCEMAHGDTYFALGWGHLEARLQTAFVQVRMIILSFYKNY